MEGFYFLSALYIANIPAGMQFWQRGINESLYTDFPLSPLRLPGRLEGRTDSAEYVKTMTIKQKHGYHLIQHEPAFPDDKFRAAAGNLLPAVQR